MQQPYRGIFSCFDEKILLFQCLAVLGKKIPPKPGKSLCERALERVFQKQAEVNMIGEQRAFAAGFRLAVQLMAESLE